MNYIRGKIPLEIFGIKDYEKVKLINLVVEVCKRNNLGKRLKKQRISFNSKEIDILKRISKFILWIYDNECRNFRTLRETEELIKTIIVSLKKKKKVLFFALFCPGYKKDRGVYGFNHPIGNTTQRGIFNLSAIFKKARLLKIPCKALAIYSDLTLENADKLKEKDLFDLKKNFDNFKKKGIQFDPKIKFIKLSEIENCKKKIGFTGSIEGLISLSRKEIQRIVKRSFPFYKEILGWNEESILKRTENLAQSCSIMANEIRNFNSLLIKVMTENIYERAKFYQGNEKNKFLPIFYPKKLKKER